MGKAQMNRDLRLSAASGYLEKCEQYLGQGADINSTDADGWTPLHIAAFRGHIELVKLFLAKRETAINAKDQEGKTPLHKATQCENLEIIKLLLKRTDIDPNVEDKDSRTPLYYAACYGRVELVELFLESSDVDPNVKDRYGWTSLHKAAHNGYVEIVKLFLERSDIDVHVKNKTNKTPFEIIEEDGLESEEKKRAKRTVKQLLQKHEDKAKMITEFRGLDTSYGLQEILQLGQYKCFWNRVYIVGPYFSGKSCLAKILVGDQLPQARESTDGIWIYMGRAGMELDKKEWIFIPKGDAVKEILVSMLMTLSRNEALETDDKTKLRSDESINNTRNLSNITNDPGHASTLEKTNIKKENKQKANIHVTKIMVTNALDHMNTAIESTNSSVIPTESNSLADKLNVVVSTAEISGCTPNTEIIRLDMVEETETSCRERDPCGISIEPRMSDVLCLESIEPKVEETGISDSIGLSEKDSISIDSALETKTSKGGDARIRPDESVFKSTQQVPQTSDDHLHHESTPRTTPVQSSKKGLKPAREKYKEKLEKEVATELSHDKIHKMVIRSIMEGKYKQNIIPIDIWDFGGQKDYYMTHQLFITSRGIFVVVFNGSLDLHKHMSDLSFLPGHSGKSTIAVYLLHWVNSILTYCKRSEDGFPKIVFVATHKDRIKKKNVEKHRMKLTEAIQHLFKSHAGINHLDFKPLMFVNAIDVADPEIQALRQHLMQRASEHPRWGELMPTAWVPLELQLAQQADEGVNIMSKEQIQSLNAQNELMILTDKQLETFLKVQHSLGKLLYFDTVNLRDFVIIAPAFLVDVLRSIVAEKQFRPRGKRYETIFQTMQKTGEVSRDNIDLIWTQDTFKHILQHKDYLVDILVHLDILVAEKSYDNNLSTQSKNVLRFLVPSMISSPNQTRYLKKKCTHRTSIFLSYKFLEKVMPPAFPYRFLASFVDMWDVKNYKSNKRMLFSDLAVVEVDCKHDVAVQVIENRIVVALIHSEKKENILPTIASSVQECLTAAVHRISEFYSTLSADLVATDETAESHMVMPFEIEFGVHYKKKLCFFHHEKILAAGKNFNWICSEHKVCHDVSFLELWFTTKISREICENSCKGLGRLELEQSPSDKHLRRLVSSLDIENCRELLIKLGLQLKDWNDIQQLYRPPPFHEADFKFIAMWKWKQGSRKTSFNEIQEALDEKHLLCEVFREVDVQQVLKESHISEETANKTPSSNTLQKLSKEFIGNSGTQLGIELGLEFSEIQIIQYEHRCKLVRQNREILRNWSQTKFPKPTVKELIKALQHIGKINCVRNISF